MNILLVTGSYPPMPCGVGDYVCRLAAALAGRSDISLNVLTTRLLDPPVGDPVWVHRLMPSWRLKALGTFLRFLRAIKPDIVHVQVPTQGYGAMSGLAAIPHFARMLGRTRVVQTWHELPPPTNSKAGFAMLALAAGTQALIYVRPQYPEHLTGAIGRLMGETPRYFVPNASVIPAVELTVDERKAVQHELAKGAAQDKAIVCFFGFMFAHKGVHHLFDIADPTRHHLVLIGQLRTESAYDAELRALMNSPHWKGRVTVTGFVEPERAARCLAAADAAVFPFASGGGIWNSSVHAATSQGTFTVVTSNEQSGYFPEQNVYYARPSAIDEMRQALVQYAGKRGQVISSVKEWNEIAARHVEIYTSLIER